MGEGGARDQGKGEEEEEEKEERQESSRSAMPCASRAAAALV